MGLFLILFYMNWVLGAAGDNTGHCPKFVEMASLHQKRVLYEYEEESRVANLFPNDKGLIMLKISQNEKGEVVWNMTVEIDDRYKIAPPRKYSMMRDLLVLIWDERENATTPDSAVYNEKLRCLERIVGGRVYARNDSEDDISVDFTPNGEVIWGENRLPKMVKRRKKIIAGNLKNETIITFKRDGTILKQKTA
jgi:hypothetical protein